MDEKDIIARDATYRNCLAVAKAEFQEMLPAYTKINERMRLLRATVYNLSGLVGEAIEEPYRVPERGAWGTKPQATGRTLRR